MTSTESKEHRIIERVWIEIGPQGLVAAAVAIMAIGSASGWKYAVVTACVGVVAAIIWCVGMKFLMSDRPRDFQE